MDQWLIRTSRNQITGPFSKVQVCEMILEGKLEFDDEICLSNHYWLALYDRAEIKKQLGIEVSLWNKDPDEEPTDTQTETLTEQMRASEPRLVTSVHERQPFWMSARWYLIIGGVVLILASLRLLGLVPFI